MNIKELHRQVDEYLRLFDDYSKEIREYLEYLFYLNNINDLSEGKNECINRLNKIYEILELMYKLTDILKRDYNKPFKLDKPEKIKIN